MVVEVERHPLGQRCRRAHHPVEPPQHVVPVAVVRLQAGPSTRAGDPRSPLPPRRNRSRVAATPSRRARRAGPPPTDRTRRASTGGRSADRSVATPPTHHGPGRATLHGDSAERSARVGTGVATATLGPMFETTTLPNGVRILTAPHGWRAVGRRLRRASPPAPATSAAQRPASPTSASTCSSRAPSAVRRARHRLRGRLIGGEFNAFTGKEFTGYYSSARPSPARGARRAVRHAPASRFDADEIEREKGVISRR